MLPPTKIKNITLIGPNGIRLYLDASQVIPHDPGDGTPAMVYLPIRGEKERFATYWCAIGENAVEDVELSIAQWDWLDDKNSLIHDFISKREEEIKALSKSK